MVYAGYGPGNKVAESLNPYQRALQSLPLDKAHDILELLDKITRNVVRNPGEEKFRRLSLSNKKIATAVSDAPSMLEVLTESGWIEETHDVLVLPLSVRLVHEIHVVGIINAKDFFKKELENEQRRRARARNAGADTQEALRELQMDRRERGFAEQAPVTLPTRSSGDRRQPNMNAKSSEASDTVMQDPRETTAARQRGVVSEPQGVCAHQAPQLCSWSARQVPGKGQDGVVATPAGTSVCHRADHVLIIGIDGLGGLFLEKCLPELPRISKLASEGMYTMRARTVYPSVSAPAWTAVLTGQGPVESGVQGNDWRPDPDWLDPSPGLSAIGDIRSNDAPMAHVFFQDVCCRWHLTTDMPGSMPVPISEAFSGFPLAKVDAVLRFPDGVGPNYAQKKAYMFCDGHYCKLDIPTNSICQGPREIGTGFPCFPFSSVDAILVFPPGVGPAYARNVAYIFCQDHYCKWNLEVDCLSDAPQKISDGFPEYPFPCVDAVFVFPPGVGAGYTNNVAYLFWGEYYCKWDLTSDTLSAQPRQIAHGFNGMPFPNLSAVCLLQEGEGKASSPLHAIPSVSGRGCIPETMWKVAKASWSKSGVAGTTAAALGWDWIHYLCGDCDIVCREGPDDQAAAAMAELICSLDPPRLMFVHLDDVDHAGHAHCWGSEAYYASMHGADRNVGKLLDALDKAGIAERTLVLVLSDHGGVGCNHGGFSQAEMFVPFLARGRQVRKGVKWPEDFSVSLLDVSPTALYALGIEPGRHMRGRLLHELWED